LKLPLERGCFPRALQSAVYSGIATGHTLKLFDTQIQSREQGAVAVGYESADFVAHIEHWWSPLLFGCPQHKNRGTGGKAGKSTRTSCPGKRPTRIPGAGRALN
jgi:hypothetical protein